MRKIKVTIWFLFLVISLWSQQGFITAYDDSIPDRVIFQDMLIDNDTIVLYSVAFDTSGVQGIRFYKIDSTGQILKQRMYVGTNGNVLAFRRLHRKIIRTADGGYAMGSGVNSVGVGKPYFLKVNHELELEMLEMYPGALYSSEISLLQMIDNGYLLLILVSEGNGVYHPAIIRTDPNGKELWRKEYDETEYTNNPFNLKMIDENTYVVLSSRVEIPSFPYQSRWGKLHVFAIDSLGNKKWDKETNVDDNNAGAWDCDFLPDGDMICTGVTWDELPNSPGSYGVRPQIFRLDGNFNLKWQHIYSNAYGNSNQDFPQLVKMPDGNYLASGNMLPSFPYGGLAPTDLRAIHFKFTPNGDSLWMRRDSVFLDNLPSHRTWVTGTGLLSSGSIISVGTTEKKTGLYGFMMKLRPDGCLDTLHCWPVGVSEPVFAEADLEVYPNPASDYVFFVNHLGWKPKSELVIVDVLGRVVRSVSVSGDVRIDVSSLARGLYFYRVLVDGQGVGAGDLVVE